MSACNTRTLAVNLHGVFEMWLSVLKTLMVANAPHTDDARRRRHNRSRQKIRPLGNPFGPPKQALPAGPSFGPSQIACESTRASTIRENVWKEPAYS